MAKKVLVIFGLMIFFPHLTSAVFSYDIEHVPPKYEVGSTLQVSISDTGISRARILISDQDGIKIKKLEKVDNQFRADIDFLRLALLKYRFQIEFNDGHVALSAYYYVRQPANEALEEQIRNLNNMISVTQTRIRQVENGINSLNAMPAAVFQKKKSEELGKALIVLRKKEKEYEQAQREAEILISKWQGSVAKAEYGRSVTSNRQEMLRNDKLGWNSKLETKVEP